MFAKNKLQFEKNNFSFKAQGAKKKLCFPFNSTYYVIEV